jgi:hypothetical protein
METTKTAAAKERKYVPMDYLEGLSSIEDSFLALSYDSNSYLMRKMREMKMRSDGDMGIYCPFFDFEENLTNIKLVKFIKGKDEIYLAHSNFIFDLNDGYNPSFFNENSIFKRSQKLLPARTEPILIVSDEFFCMLGSIFYPQLLWLATGGIELTEKHADMILSTDRSCVFIYQKNEYKYAKSCKEYLRERGVQAKVEKVDKSGFEEYLLFYNKMGSKK